MGPLNLNRLLQTFASCKSEAIPHVCSGDNEFLREVIGFLWIKIIIMIASLKITLTNFMSSASYISSRSSCKLHNPT